MKNSFTTEQKMKESDLIENDKQAEKVGGVEEEEQLVKKIPPPDSGYAWVILIAAFFVSFILDGMMYSWGVILQPIKANYNETNERANLLSALNTGFLFSSGPVASGLVNQFGCRSVVVGGGFITGLVYFVSVFAPTINMMMISYGVIGGISTGVTYIASLIVIPEYFDKKRGIATGLTMAGSGVGSFVFAPLVEKIIEKLDWKFTMVICAGIILLTCFCGVLLKPLNPKVSIKNQKKKNIKKLTDDKEERKIVQTFSGSMSSLNPTSHKRNSCSKMLIDLIKETFNFKLLIQNWRFLLITISNFFVFTGYFTPFLFITKIAQDNNISNAPFIISIIGIVNIPCRIMFGYVADRRFISPINLNSLSIAVATVPLFVYSFLQYHFWSQAIFAVVFAIGMAGLNCLTTMYLCDLVGLERFSNATGIVNLFRGFGCFIGPFLGGYIADKYTMITSFYFSGACFFLGFVLAAIVSFGTAIKTCTKSKQYDQNQKTDVELNLFNK